MRFEAFKRATHSHQFSLAVLNCCSTFEFALGNKIPNASTCILHQDLVLRDVAYNFMECFFQTFEHTKDVHLLGLCGSNSNEILQDIIVFFLI